MNIVFYIQDFWATCACPEKQSVPWIHRIECIFYPSEFWRTCACPEKQNLPWNFSLYWNIFYLSGFLNRVCPEFFKSGGRPPPPSRLIRHWSDAYQPAIYSSEFACQRTANCVATLLLRKSTGFYHKKDYITKKTLDYKVFISLLK